MYTAEEFKQDVLANMKGNKDYEVFFNILSFCEFQFVDSGEFTYKVWNTYKRDLVISCSADDRLMLEEYDDFLYGFCNKIHGNKDDYLLMSLKIIAKASLTKNRLTSQDIIISKNIIIDRMSNEVGKGGFGKVYKYYDEATEEMYAYKIFEPTIFQESEPEIMKKRFIREGKKLLHYSHESVVKAYDFGFLGDESAYIKMEFISGKKLNDFLSSNELSIEKKENLCMQYISAMAYVHGKSDMHRDISYSNVMVDESDNIKVLDFGFSRGKDDTNYDTHYRDIEHKFTIPGEIYSEKTEVYCIGAILFSILINSEFDREKIDKLNEVDCNAKLIACVHKCLQKNIENRFENAIELKNALISEDIKVDDIAEYKNDFSLDYFRKMLYGNIWFVFKKGELPNKETIKKWIEVDLADLIEAHTFVSEINLIAFVNRVPNLFRCNQIQTSSCKYSKSVFHDMYSFYYHLPEKMKVAFIKNMLMIVLENSTEDEGELPFV